MRVARRSGRLMENTNILEEIWKLKADNSGEGFNALVASVLADFDPLSPDKMKIFEEVKCYLLTTNDRLAVSEVLDKCRLLDD